MGTTPGYVVILLFLGKALHVALAKADGGSCETEGVSEDQKKVEAKTREEWKLRLIQF